jgi:tetratricopeptide (TPR) repeat protein
MKMNKQAHAIAEVKAALRLNPSVARYRLLLGDIYASGQNYLAALKEYQEAIEINSYIAEAHQKAGQSFFKLEQHQQAIFSYRIALNINPNLSEAHCDLGDIFFKLHQYRVASDQYQAALNHNSKLSSAYAGLGDICMIYRKHGQALKLYRKALQTRPIACVAGNNYFDQKRYGAAVAEYRKALGRPSSLPGIRKSIGKIIIDQELRKDRRKHDRYLFRVPLEVQSSEGTHFTATSVDISKQGMLIESPHLLKVGSPLELSTALQKDGSRIKLKGKVVRMVKDDSSTFRLFGVQLSAAADDYPIWESLLAA